MKQPHREEHHTLRWPPEPMSPPPSRETRPLLADRYRLLRPIGMGGMSTVFEAEDTVLDRVVAVKVLHRTIDDRPEVMERFQREVGVGAVVGHPNIVEVLDSGATEEGTPFLVMEMLEGQSLSEQLGHGPLPPKEAVGIVLQVLAALQTAHERGIIHRDLKPDNVFLCRDGVVKVLDFGIAKLDEAMHEVGRSLSGELVVGTPAYMSPEQASGRTVDARTDVYAVGALLYEMLSGQPPYSGDPHDIMHAIVSRDPMPLARRS